MRTTVTIDDEVARLLKEAMHRQRTNFKQALNSALRRGLTVPAPSAVTRQRFSVQGPFLGRMQTGVDPAGFNKLADQLEDEAIVGKLRRDEGR
jgi:hypothetical protein